MAQTSDRERTGRDIYNAIGNFMFEQGLDPSPTNYMLLHQLVTGSNPAAVAAIERATSDGLRLTQKEADRIMTAVGIAVEDREAASVAVAQAMNEVRRQMDSFSSLVSSTHAATRDYEQDLESSAQQLGTDSNSLADLIRITSSMLERTRAAESQLEAATGEADALREKLVNAQQEARRDPLTGIPNRRAFEDHYAELQAKGVPFSLAICDVDRFKTINDTHGHGVGDRVLKTVAQTLAAAFDEHMVARVGGEEFVVLLPRLNAEEAARVVEIARAAVSERRLKVRETDKAVDAITISAGIAFCDGVPIEDALRRADALLYRAKAAGRDRVVAEGRPG